MNLRSRGYKEAKVEKRDITLAELKLAIIEVYVNHGEKEVQVIDITCGEIETFHTIKDVVDNNWCGDVPVEIINLPHTYGTKECGKTIIIIQLAEDAEQVIK